MLHTRCSLATIMSWAIALLQGSTACINLSVASSRHNFRDMLYSLDRQGAVKTNKLHVALGWCKHID
jgi:hypothetical protein